MQIFYKIILYKITQHIVINIYLFLCFGIWGELWILRGGIGFDFLFGCFFFNRAVFSVERTNVFLHVGSFGLPVNI